MKAILLCGLTFSLLILSILAQAEVVRVVHESQGTCSAPCQKAAVVFIHGLMGSKETWQNGTSFWPSLLATDPDIGDKVDVYRVDFDSYLFAPGPSIVDVLGELQEQLDSLFETNQYSKIFLVGHSLGGNIARAYLLHIKAKYGHRVLSLFPVTYTLGTPMLGSSLAPIALFASQNQHLRVLLPIKVNDFQQLLNLTLVDMMNKHHHFFCPQMSLFAAYEMQPMGIAGIVVSKESATIYSTFTRGFNKNHSTLVKPLNRSDLAYKWVTDSMSTCIAGKDYCSKPILPDCGRLPEGWPNPQFEVVPRLSPASGTR